MRQDAIIGFMAYQTAKAAFPNATRPAILVASEAARMLYQGEFSKIAGIVSDHVELYATALQFDAVVYERRAP